MSAIAGPCRARLPEICGGMAHHRHHRQRRRKDNRDVNLLELCFACHEHIHRNPRWAYSWGLLVPSWSDPELVDPVDSPDPGSLGPYADDQ